MSLNSFDSVPAFYKAEFDIDTSEIMHFHKQKQNCYTVLTLFPQNIALVPLKDFLIPHTSLKTQLAKAVLGDALIPPSVGTYKYYLSAN